MTHSTTEVLEKVQTEFFPISGTNKNGHNSRTSNDADMKLEAQFKLEKGNAIMSKKLFMLAIYEVIVVCQMYDQISAKQKPDSGCMDHSF